MGSEKHAHVCVMCDTSYMNDNEYLSLCPDCLRKHNIDLAIQEEVMKHQDEAVDKLHQISRATIEKIDGQHKDFLIRSKKRMKRSQIFMIAYSCLLVAWVLFQLFYEK